MEEGSQREPLSSVQVATVDIPNATLPAVLKVIPDETIPMQGQQMENNSSVIESSSLHQTRKEVVDTDTSATKTTNLSLPGEKMDMIDKESETFHRVNSLADEVSLTQQNRVEENHIPSNHDHSVLENIQSEKYVLDGLSVSNPVKESELVVLLVQSDELNDTIQVRSSDSRTNSEKTEGTEFKSLESLSSVPITEADASTENSGSSTEQKIRFLESELAEAQSTILGLQCAMEESNNDKSSVLLELQMELQEKLQSESRRKVEAENRSRALDVRVKDLESVNQRQADELREVPSLRTKLQQQITARSEAENVLRITKERVQELERETKLQKYEIEEYNNRINQLHQRIIKVEKEVVQCRTDRDEQERLQMSATTRLNMAKKNEAMKVNLADKYEDLMISALAERDQARDELKETQSMRQTLEHQLEQCKLSSSAEIQNTLKLLEVEIRLNDERKQKMKAFLESKAEESRQAKEDNDALQMELTQTNKSLVDLNARLNQLHNQWVVAQTRNRELQRDLNKIKKDSENLHKVGDTLEMKLSRSANETEEHKSKRLAAKQELMTVLRTLEIERQNTNKLKESIKFKFTQLALNQQQALNDAIESLDRQLFKLATRLGKPSFPVDRPGNSTSLSTSLELTSTINGGGNSHTEMDNTTFVLTKFEHETQCVTDSIRKVANGINRIGNLIDDSGERTCYTALSELVASSARSLSLTATTVTTSPSTGSTLSLQDPNRNAVESPNSSQPTRLRMGIARHRYGQLSDDSEV